jgi:hypothetical protein
VRPVLQENDVCMSITRYKTEEIESSIPWWGLSDERNE